MASSGLDLDRVTLSETYERITQLLGNLEGGGGSSGSAEAQRLLAHCELLVERAALFSSNEDEDDLATSHLKYMLVPFMHAELLSSQPTRDPGTRLQQLNTAHQYYCQYLQRCQQYRIIKGCVHDAYTAEEQGSSPDPGTARNQRMERFKRSKAIQQLLQQMKCRQQQADEESGIQPSNVGGLCGWDEEDERQLWSLQLEAAAIKALDSRPLLQQEMQLLRHAAAQQHQEQQQGGSVVQGQPRHGCASKDASVQDQQRQQLHQQMMHKLAGIAGQLSLSGDRQALRQQVFRPSHILPTLTVEQQGAIEIAQAREREARQREAEAAAAARKADARSDDEDESELAKARAWDDFKDDNPRGWGNSKLRPCA